jgi:hypothetical protein
MERPILMSTPMVQAIIAGTKTQTRRIVKDINKCPYKAGDILWVRETYCDITNYKQEPLFSSINGNFVYKANTDFIGEHKWKPSIFMPKEASRISLLVKNIRVEKLQDISESDAVAEGIIHTVDTKGNSIYKVQGYPQYEYSAILAYKSLWESINGVGSWESNPFVWVVEFERMINHPTA